MTVKRRQIASTKQPEASSTEDEDENDKKQHIQITTQPWPKLWIFLVTLRFGFTVFIQRGYIHPDEFFQGLEVLSGRIFNCTDHVHLTWEFHSNNSMPIRDMLVPYVFYGLPLHALKLLATHTPFATLQAKTLLYYPRLVTTLSSLAVDVSLARLSQMNGLDITPVLLMFASSYVSLVYLTRTFSNSIETVLFALLLHFVMRSIKQQRILCENFLVEKSNKTIVNPSERSLLFLDLPPLQSQTSNKHSLQRVRLFDIYKFNGYGSIIGCLICVGIFNRPTFVLYALIPVAYWTLYGMNQCNGMRQALSFVIPRVLSMLKSIVPLTGAFVLFDTAFYKHRGSGFVFTPINFFTYNSNADNVRQHGSHPFYQHLVVNCTLLFGMAHVILCLMAVHFFLIQRPKFKSLINNTCCFYMLCYFVPLAVFSLVPHQEPRFLLPLVVPVCLLTAQCLSRSALLRVAWVTFNVTLVLVYGYVHQGGVVPALVHVQKMFVHASNAQLDQHVIFYRTYMPPRFLASVPSRQLEVAAQRATVYSAVERQVYDIMSSGKYDELEKVVANITQKYKSAGRVSKDYALFLVTPSMFDMQLKVDSDGTSCLPALVPSVNITYHLQTKFAWHVTFEHLDEHLSFIRCDKQLQNFCNLDCRKMNIWQRIQNTFSMHFYQILV